MPSVRPPSVVVVGGGPAATELGFVLREHAPGAVALTYVVPPPGASARPMPGVEAFSEARRRAHDLPTVVSALGARLRSGRVVSVDGDRHRVQLADGGVVPYDLLVLAPGARARRVLDSAALTLYGDAGPMAADRVIAELHGDHRRPLSFVVPPGVTRAPSLYELAVLAGLEARARAPGARLRLFTPEPAPLSTFERGARTGIADLLEEAGVAVVPSASVFEALDGRARVGAVRTLLGDDHLVALPVLEGPALPGVPTTPDGFIPIDDHGAVCGLEDVFAAGDGTTCPVKHVDVACSQASTIADVIAARAGVEEILPGPWSADILEHQLDEHGLGPLRHDRLGAASCR
ncbi:MAG TPA: FAD/NAD(P)-binding oxidoreductase [Baekduia sp.]|uniref:FAD/NAD(P)-binding oxidoreductase n=1 Tax=Baekduia sp. TaxID=2600305 RepID=UPI002D77A6E5|nr:FAD/NAD(P)-binding oxidoreductase [Baekduia sp.]HET6508107.1 FAD/NAD(P)-binding oxidoreductase [Baekduia sp.]